MLAKISSKHQITIPRLIAAAFGLRGGDVLEIEKRGQTIVMVPKEVIYEDKYPLQDLEATEKALSGGVADEEVKFASGEEMIEQLKKRMKKLITLF